MQELLSSIPKLLCCLVLQRQGSPIATEISLNSYPSTIRWQKKLLLELMGLMPVYFIFERKKNYFDNFEKAIDLPIYIQGRQQQRAERDSLESFLWLAAFGTVVWQRWHSAEIIHFIISGTQKGNYAGHFKSNLCYRDYEIKPTGDLIRHMAKPWQRGTDCLL